MRLKSHLAYGLFIAAISLAILGHSNSLLKRPSPLDAALSFSSHLRSSYENRRCGWMMTFSRRARTKQYARGKERPRVRITSAMQMVAERETPTRQWTSVAVPLAFPRSSV